LTMDWDTPAVLKFVEENSGNSEDPVKQSVAFYYAVRDKIRYDPYSFDLSVKGLRASSTLEKGRGWCVPKANLLATCCRAVGIPARIGFADVKNHISTKRLRQTMKTDIFFWHGYSSIFLNNVWIKSTPAFNIELCERFRIKPLDFDGKNDSFLHSFDLNGKKHMEYLNLRGEYADIPIDEIRKTFKKRYSQISKLKNVAFDNDVEDEIAG